MDINYLTIRKAARMFGVGERQMRRMCIDNELPGAIREGRFWRIPAGSKIKPANKPDSPVGNNELLDVPADKKIEAIRRLGLIKDFEGFATGFIRNGGLRRDAAENYCIGKKINKRSLYRWLKRYREQGLLGLIDTRGGGRFLSQMISTEAFEYFKSIYLTQQRLSVKTCWQNINFLNKDRNEGWKIPPLYAMYRYIKNRIPLAVTVLHREGLRAYEALCAPYISIDPDSIEPGQVWVGDHSQFNCWIRHKDRWVRSWITAWQDMRSRAIIGRCINFSPNQTTVLRAMKQAIEQYGPPESVKIDNGKDYDSEMWTGTTKEKRRLLKKGYLDEQLMAGLYAHLGITASFSIPYHPQSKPIERWFDTLDQQFTKTLPTYCGKDTERKPDYLKDLLNSERTIAEAYDLTGFTQLVDRYIEAYNNSAHTGLGMANRSPAEVMATRQSRRVMLDGTLDLLMRVWSREIIVGKNGVRIKGMWYGQYDTNLLMHQGRKVLAAYDPDDLRKAYIYDAATFKLLTIAEQNRLIAYGSAVSEESLREAMAQKSRAIKIIRQFKNSQLTANMDLTNLTIRAMQEGHKEPQERQQTLRPVATIMDKQVIEHKREEIIKAVRKAAGAESVKTVLNFDFDALKPKNLYEDMKIFND